MRLTDLLALSHVPRWSIIRHAPSQSVGDHTFRTCVIALELCERLKVTKLLPGVLRAVLTHDGAESRTADMPRPFKLAMQRNEIRKAENRMCPWIADEPEVPQDVTALVGLADLVECYTFIVMHGEGPTAGRVKTHLAGELYDYIEFNGFHSAPVLSVVDDILEERDRYPILP